MFRAYHRQQRPLSALVLVAAQFETSLRPRHRLRARQPIRPVQSVLLGGWPAGRQASVYAIIKQAQNQHLAEGVEYHRNIELARLNSLQAALWPRAEQGDVAAAWACLKLIMARCRLLGLFEQPGSKTPQDQWDNCQGPPTVIVRADDCRHAGCDRHGQFAQSG